MEWWSGGVVEWWSTGGRQSGRSECVEGNPRSRWLTFRIKILSHFRPSFPLLPSVQFSSDLLL